MMVVSDSVEFVSKIYIEISSLPAPGCAARTIEPALADPDVGEVERQYTKRMRSY